MQQCLLRWNGTAWKQVRSPNPSPDHAQCLFGVAAASARNAWAAGYTDGGGKTLIVETAWGCQAWSGSSRRMFTGRCSRITS